MIVHPIGQPSTVFPQWDVLSSSTAAGIGFARALINSTPLLIHGRDDDDDCCIGGRLKLERETEKSGFLAKKRVSMKAGHSLH